LGAKNLTKESRAAKREITGGKKNPENETSIGESWRYNGAKRKDENPVAATKVCRGWSDSERRCAVVPKKKREL